MDINFAPTLTSPCEASCLSVVMKDCYVALIGRRELSNSGSIGSALCSVLHQFSGLSTDADDMQVGPKTCSPFNLEALSPESAEVEISFGISLAIDNQQEDLPVLCSVK